jgi:hypothetical protein
LGKTGLEYAYDAHKGAGIRTADSARVDLHERAAKRIGRELESVASSGVFCRAINRHKTVHCPKRSASTSDRERKQGFRLLHKTRISSSFASSLSFDPYSCMVSQATGKKAKKVNKTLI